ncbi:MAG: nitroreductase family protein [Dehalococcoidia bacterium]|nr:nitroreductase family protein [Dehalococcoidia bacterium]
MMKDLVLKNRSYRRFYQDCRIESGLIRELIDMARLCGSAGNLQPLKYIFSCDPERNALIFPYLTWARYLKDWPGPREGEKPTACIVVLGDTDIARSFGCDHGIAAQTILLGAVEKGLGGCMIASVDREGLRQALNIPLRFEILLVLAIGKPREKVVIEALKPEGDFKYWRDGSGVHHVPKRRLDDIVLDNS